MFNDEHGGDQVVANHKEQYSTWPAAMDADAAGVSVARRPTEG
jgi:uncharacterized protein YbdZ (MbtH family)